MIITDIRSTILNPLRYQQNDQYIADIYNGMKGKMIRISLKLVQEGPTNFNPIFFQAPVRSQQAASY